MTRTMRRYCPTCGQFTIRPGDARCPGCGYPPSDSYPTFVEISEPEEDNDGDCEEPH